MAVGERLVWHKRKYTRILEALSQIDCGLEFSSSKVCEDFLFLKSVLLFLIDKFIPSMPIHSGRPWAVKAPLAIAQEILGGMAGIQAGL